MERREFVALLGFAAAMLPAAAGASTASASAAGESGKIGERLIGTWGFVRSINTRRDGTTFDRWGADPRGVFVFDRGGRFVQVIIGSESRVFGSKIFSAFGQYEVDEEHRLVRNHIEACSNPRYNGMDQERTILTLTKEMLVYRNPGAIAGSVAEVAWERLV